MPSPDDFAQAFVEEATELLSELEEALLALEATPDDAEIIGRVFRAMHTIKGSGAMFGFTEIAEFTHHVETLLDHVRGGRLAVTRELIDVVLASRDHITGMLSVGGKTDAAGAERGRAIVATIQSLLGGVGEGRGPQVSTDSAASSTAGGGRDLVTYRIRFRPNPGIFGTGTDPAMLLDELGELGECRVTAHCENVPALPDFNAEHCYLWWEIVLATTQGAEAVKSVFVFVDEDDVQVAAEPSPAKSACRAPGAVADRQLAVFVQSAGQQVACITACNSKFRSGDISEPVRTAFCRAVKTLKGAAEYMARMEFVEPAKRLLELAEGFQSNRDTRDEALLQAIDAQTAVLGPLLDLARDEAVSGAATPRLGELEAALRAPLRAGDRIVAQGLATREEVEDAAGGQTTSTASARTAAAKTMRVDQEKLDSYLTLAAELLVARNGLTHAFQAMQNNKGSLRHLKDAIEGIHRLAGGIQDNAMAMRMIPVKSVFQRFPRMVRDIAKSQGKRIDFQVFGEETELDKQVADALADPLVHVIRNAADHGIETPEKRRAAGKSESGIVTLRASREGNVIVIDVTDDGAGIHVDGLKAKAVENGILTQPQADAMSREEALQLIFAPGLSTSKVVSDISGRGVGMDVVRNNVAALSGSVSIASQDGKGTQMRIQLPLTLAVTTVVLVGCGGETYALPMEAVNSTVKLRPSEIKTMNHEYVISLRGEVVGVKPLARLLSAHRGAEHAGAAHSLVLAQNSAELVPIVIMSAGETRFGLMVDEVKGQQDIVVKPLPGYLAQLPCLSGATIMGDGTIVLVLDLARVFDFSKNPPPQKLAEIADCAA
jgi:two-component system chemotaxis sensor kinase CheA